MGDWVLGELRWCIENRQGKGHEGYLCLNERWEAWKGRRQIDGPSAAFRRGVLHHAPDGFPVISPDGKTLAFSSNRDEPEGVRTLSPYLMDISSLQLGSK